MNIEEKINLITPIVKKVAPYWCYMLDDLQNLYQLTAFENDCNILSKRLIDSFYFEVIKKLNNNIKGRGSDSLFIIADELLKINKYLREKFLKERKLY